MTSFSQVLNLQQAIEFCNGIAGFGAFCYVLCLIRK
jgi:hypothetical protein